MPKNGKSDPKRNPKTSAICFDADGNLVAFGGEFSQLKSINDANNSAETVLAEYLSKFDLINRGVLGADEPAISKFIKRWGNPDSVPVEAKFSDESWRLLTSYVDEFANTRFLSINIDDQKRQQALASFLLENHPLPIWANETETGKVVYSNPAANKIYENSPQSHEENRISDFLGSEDISREMLGILKSKGYIDNYDIKTKNESGNEIWVSGCAKLANNNGTELVVSSIQNITDRKNIENADRRAMNMLRDAIESLTEGFAIYDEKYRLVMFNRRYFEMNNLVGDLLKPGLKYETMLRTMAERGGYTDAKGSEEEWVRERLENATNYAKDDEVNHTNGKSYQVSIHPTKLGGFAVTRTDITERKTAEAQRREGDILVRTVLDASSAIVIMARTEDGKILYRSSAAAELFGDTKSAKEHYVDPTQREDLVKKLLSDGKVDNLQVLLNAKGKHLQTSISSRIAEYKGEEVIVTSVVDMTEQIKSQELLQQVLEACQIPIQMTSVKTGDLLFSTPETTALFGPVKNSRDYYIDQEDRPKLLRELREKGWYKDRVARYRGADGRIFWNSQSARLLEFNGEEVIVSNTRDLTEELAIQEELKSQRELLFQNEKMSALGELLAGVAHELNNPLSVVVGHSLMLLEEANDPDLVRRVEKISVSAERCAKIVKTFLAMARQQPTQMQSTDINSVVSTAVDLVGYGSKGDDIKLDCDLGKGIPNIPADADQITQVITNLIINAEQAMASSGVGDLVKISTNVVAEDEQKNFVEIVIEDNGPGIPDEIRARVFEPFFTTKSVGEGTGIGLAFCHRTIRSHDGQIWLDPNHGPGSKFVLYLPILPTSEEDESEDDSSAIGVQGLRALVVDDEPDVAELICEILQSEGIQVDIANSGKTATKFIESGRYDLLLSDINMPNLGGRELYEILKTRHPKLLDRMGFITGDTLGSASMSLLQESNLPCLEKPVTPGDLRDLIRGILGVGKRSGE